MVAHCVGALIDGGTVHEVCVREKGGHEGLGMGGVGVWQAGGQ